MDLERLLPMKRQISDEVFPVDNVPTSISLVVVLIASNLLVLTWSIVLLRLYTRTFFSRLGYDDLFMVFALVCFSIFGATTITMEAQSWLRLPMTGRLITKITNLLLVVESFQILGMVCLKISLGLFFNRILNQKWQKRALYAIMTITLLIGLGYWLFSIFQCGIPNQGTAFWMKKISNECVSDASAVGFGYANGLINAITDVMLCALPIPTIWNAKLSRKEKGIVSGIFVLAIMGSIASIFRIAYTKTLIDKSPQFWVHIQPLTIVVILELGLGIIAASLATMRPLLQRARRVLRSYRTKLESSASWRSLTTNSLVERVKKSKSSSKIHSVITSDGTLTGTATNCNDKNFLLSATNHNVTFFETINTNDTLRSFDEKELLSMESASGKSFPFKTVEFSTIDDHFHSYGNPTSPYSPKPDINQSLSPTANGGAVLEPTPPMSAENTQDTSLSGRHPRAIPITYPARTAVPNVPSNIPAFALRTPRAVPLIPSRYSTARATQGSLEISSEDSETSNVVPVPLENGYRRWVIRPNLYNS